MKMKPAFINKFWESLSKEEKVEFTTAANVIVNTIKINNVRATGVLEVGNILKKFPELNLDLLSAYESIQKTIEDGNIPYSDAEYFYNFFSCFITDADDKKIDVTKVKQEVKKEVKKEVKTAASNIQVGDIGNWTNKNGKWTVKVTKIMNNGKLRIEVQEKPVKLTILANEFIQK